MTQNHAQSIDTKLVVIIWYILALILDFELPPSIAFDPGAEPNILFYNNWLILHIYRTFATIY